MPSRLRIVVADDDECVRTFLTSALVHLGHEVIAADGGGALVGACLATAPDLIISDVQMPDLDGITAVGIVRRRVATPVLFLSGGWDDDALGRAARLGAVWCLAKPIRPLELSAALEKVAGTIKVSAGL